jgi:N-formylglutamate amidohydrolase
MLSVPHAAREYPGWLVARARGGLAALTPLEDPHVDSLIVPALARGIGAVIAMTPRAAIDCNRAEDEVGAAGGARARGGLGLVPTRTARDGWLWREPVAPDEVGRRLDEAHRPYHAALKAALTGLERQVGAALLLDCHSMPPRGPGQPHIVLGDRHGTSAAPWVVRLAGDIVRGQGFRCAVNDPFAGGHIIAAHGRPSDGIHALQIEIDRSLYCRADARTPGVGFARVALLIERLAVELGTAVGQRQAEAAE